MTPDTQEAVERLIRYSERRLGITPTILSTDRTCAEQNALYAKGRTIAGSVVTNAQGCQSWHVLGRAVDISLGPGAPRSQYEALGRYWESLGGGWGGRFQGLDDLGHFEWHPGVKNFELCPDPTACQSGLRLSQAMYLPVGGSGAGWMALVGALAVAGYVYFRK